MSGLSRSWVGVGSVRLVCKHTRSMCWWYVNSSSLETNTYMSSVEVFTTGIQAIKALFVGGWSRDQGDLQTTKNQQSRTGTAATWSLTLENQAINHTFRRSKNMIVVANASTGDRVTTPWKPYNKLLPMHITASSVPPAVQRYTRQLPRALLPPGKHMLCFSSSVWGCTTSHQTVTTHTWDSQTSSHHPAHSCNFIITYTHTPVRLLF